LTTTHGNPEEVPKTPRNLPEITTGNAYRNHRNHRERLNQSEQIPTAPTAAGKDRTTSSN
jgi:hypothetical protein